MKYSFIVPRQNLRQWMHFSLHSTPCCWQPAGGSDKNYSVLKLEPLLQMGILYSTSSTSHTHTILIWLCLYGRKSVCMFIPFLCNSHTDVLVQGHRTGYQHSKPWSISCHNVCSSFVDNEKKPKLKHTKWHTNTTLHDPLDTCSFGRLQPGMRMNPFLYWN